MHASHIRQLCFLYGPFLSQFGSLSRPNGFPRPQASTRISREFVHPFVFRQFRFFLYCILRPPFFLASMCPFFFTALFFSFRTQAQPPNKHSARSKQQCPRPTMTLGQRPGTAGVAARFTPAASFLFAWHCARWLISLFFCTAPPASAPSFLLLLFSPLLSPLPFCSPSFSF